MLRKKRSPDSTNYGAPAECQPDLLYGFRSRVSIVENQSCILDVTCTATGDRINAALLAKRRGQTNMSKHVQNSARQGGFAKRQSGEEFQSDAPPQCRAIRDPNNTCRAYLAVWYSLSSLFTCNHFITAILLKTFRYAHISLNKRRRVNVSIKIFNFENVVVSFSFVAKLTTYFKLRYVDREIFIILLQWKSSNPIKKISLPGRFSVLQFKVWLTLVKFWN